jgi:pseudaminic acid biosynthesis-associated methylase
VTWTPPGDGEKRLEALWAGSFGHDYVTRNQQAGLMRSAFWKDFVGRYTPRSLLEVGCNLGANLEWLTPLCPEGQVVGLDINQHALRELRRRVPNVQACLASATQLPFADEQFACVFTVGVLIHQSDAALPRVMAEIHRCARRWILCAEYYAPQRVEVPYRGQTGALIKRDFGGLYEAQFPGLQRAEKGFLPRSAGWDDVTYWVFDKQSPTRKPR